MITLKNIKKAFNGTELYGGATFEIEENKITAIMGHSGKGKTTLINIIMGLEKADCGEVLGLDGKKITAQFQENRLIPLLSAQNNLKLVCKDVDIIDSHLKSLGIDPSDKKAVAQFSGGMKRRVALARAFVAGGDITILDEPFKGLDDDNKKNAMDYVIKNAVGRTVIIVTHSVDEANYLNAKIITIN